MRLTKKKIVVLFSLAAIGYAAMKSGFVGRAQARLSELFNEGRQVVRSYNPLEQARGVVNQANRWTQCYYIALKDASEETPRQRTPAELRAVERLCNGLYSPDL